MSPITTFEELSLHFEISMDNDEDIDIEDMNLDEESLKNQIMHFTTEKLQPAIRVLHKYYGLEVPETIIKNALCKNLSLALEVYDGSVGDTCQRELLIDAVLKEINVRSWPVNYEGDKALNEFREQFQTSAPKHGVKFIK